jgi:hypothetical protein
MAGWEGLARIAKLQPPFLATATCMAALVITCFTLITIGGSIARLPRHEA